MAEALRLGTRDARLFYHAGMIERRSGTRRARRRISGSGARHEPALPPASRGRGAPRSRGSRGRGGVRAAAPSRPSIPMRASRLAGLLALALALATPRPGERASDGQLQHQPLRGDPRRARRRAAPVPPRPRGDPDVPDRSRPRGSPPTPSTPEARAYLLRAAETLAGRARPSSWTGGGSRSGAEASRADLPPGRRAGCRPSGLGGGVPRPPCRGRARGPRRPSPTGTATTPSGRAGRRSSRPPRRA